MGQLFKLNCFKCDFEYDVYDSLYFFFNEGSKKIETSPCVMLFPIKEYKESDLHGFIKIYYCYNCGKYVYEFNIIHTKWSLEDSKKIIRKHGRRVLKNIHLSSLDDLRNDSTKIICPKCNDEISILTDDSICPKCGKGKLYPGCICNID